MAADNSNTIKSKEDGLFDAENFTVKHPLQFTWTLWFDNPRLKKANESWEDSLKNIMSFDTVEDFWCLYESIMPASKIQTGSNYSIFKDGIKPMWEDENNVLGGKWVITINKPDKKNLDEWWLHAILASIGGILEHDNSDEICGLVMSSRKAHDRIALWTRTAASMELQHAIGTKLRGALKLPKKCQITYQTHDSALASGSSYRTKALYHA